MMMALIIYLFYTQTWWLNLHSTQKTAAVLRMGLPLSHYPQIFLKHSQAITMMISR
jgi:hypothetical protein